MISLIEARRIPASPERVWAFLRKLDERYRDWHPEHLAWRTLRGEPLAEGAVVFADEWIGPLRVSGRFFIEAVEDERFFAYRLGFPASLAGAGGWFRLAPAAYEHCELRQEVHLGYSLPLIGALVDRLLAAALPLGELRRHMREEQQNLAGLLSGGGEGPAAPDAAQEKRG